MTEQRKERLRTILEAILNCSGGDGCTHRELAAMLHKPNGEPLKKSPYTGELIQQIVRDGYATETMDTSRWPHVFRYRPSESYLAQRAAAAAEMVQP